MRVRRAIAADVPSMIKLERQSPGAAHWSRQQYENLFLAVNQLEGNHQAENHQARSEAFAWIVENDSVEQERLLGETAEPLAFLVAQRVDADWELENMAVAYSVRRRGIGTLLLRELIAQAVTEGVSKIFLEVRASNQSARALYQKTGFEEIGLRKSYYSDPNEDAILYRLSCR